jgi:hypothetical protein
MFQQNKKGWWWSINIYNYLTRETKPHNSPQPFLTYEEAFADLLSFLEALNEENKRKKKLAPKDVNA